MKGAIIVNAYSESESYLYQAKRLKEEFAAAGVRADIIKNRCGIAYIGADGEIILGFRADFAVFLDKDKYLMRLLERAGMRLFNRAQAIELCDDKMGTHIALQGCGVPMPSSVPAPLCYTPDAPLPEGYVSAVVRALGLPVVVKNSYGSLGGGVWLAETEKELADIDGRLRCEPHFYQSFVAESRGRDLRVVAVGGRAVAAMERTSLTDFRSNAALGGRCAPVPVPPEAERMAGTVSARLGLDYCGIDFLFGGSGLVLCEVNSNAFFCSLERVTGVNVAGAYVRHILVEMARPLGRPAFVNQ